MILMESDDANFHKRGPEKDWRESYYCNFVDLNSDLCGVAWQGARPNSGEGEAVFILCDGKKDLVRSVNMHVPVPLTDDPGRKIGFQEAVCLEPWRRWDVRYREGNAKVDVEWTQMSDFCDYDAYMDTRHFEAAGKVKVTGKIGDREVAFTGYGERDRAWGVRNYGPIQFLIWMTAQFSDDVAVHVFVLLLNEENPVYKLSGFLHKDGQTRGLASCEASLTYDGDRGPPTGGSMILTDDLGRKLEIDEFKIINHVGFGASDDDASKLDSDLSKSKSLMFLTFQTFRRRDGVLGKGMLDLNCWAGNHPAAIKSLPPLCSTLYPFGRQGKQR
jgi:hypothetical protein